MRWRDSNVDALKQNGRIYFLDRPLEKLIPTEDRPLASTADAIKKRYEERYERYSAVCNKRIGGDLTPEESAEIIIKEHTT